MRTVSNDIALTPTVLIFQMLANFIFGIELLKTVSKSVCEKEKKMVVVHSCPPENVKSRRFTSSSCNDDKEMYKKE